MQVLFFVFSGPIILAIEEGILNPDKKPVHGTTFVTNEINYQIDKDLYDKQAGIWSINVTVNEKLQGTLEFEQK